MHDVKTVHTAADLAASLRLRREVFIEEQGVPEADEYDDRDAECAHFLVWAAPEAASGNGALEEPAAVGTARLLETDDGRAKAQRVAVRRTRRGEGIGRALMVALEDEARRRGFDALHLDAQLESEAFYRQLGYAPYGEVFEDAGIPHRCMCKRLAPDAG